MLNYCPIAGIQLMWVWPQFPVYVLDKINQMGRRNAALCKGYARPKPAAQPRAPVRPVGLLRSSLARPDPPTAALPETRFRRAPPRSPRGSGRRLGAEPRGRPGCRGRRDVERGMCEGLGCSVKNSICRLPDGVSTVAALSTGQDQQVST